MEETNIKLGGENGGESGENVENGDLDVVPTSYDLCAAGASVSSM